MIEPTLYELLGLPPTATLDEIKAAYRKAASEAHPDKGGSVDRMAAMNRAYEVLSDPVRRLGYDTDGQTAISNAEKEARDKVLEAFATVLQRDVQSGVLIFARNWMVERRAAIQGIHRNASAVRDRMLSRRDKLRARKGVNLFNQLIDAEVRNITPQLAQMERDIAAYTRAIEMLNDYDSLEQTMFLEV